MASEVDPTFCMQRCNACGRHRHPPAPTCEQCGSSLYDWLGGSGHGTLFTWTRASDGPIIAVVELDEGPRVISALEVVGEPVIGRRLKYVDRTGVEAGVLLTFAESNDNLGTKEAE